jgi:hypothetical protein
VVLDRKHVDPAEAASAAGGRRTSAGLARSEHGPTIGSLKSDRLPSVSTTRSVTVFGSPGRVAVHDLPTAGGPVPPYALEVDVEDLGLGIDVVGRLRPAEPDLFLVRQEVEREIGWASTAARSSTAGVVTDSGALSTLLPHASRVRTVKTYWCRASGRDPERANRGDREWVLRRWRNADHTPVLT